MPKDPKEELLIALNMQKTEFLTAYVTELLIPITFSDVKDLNNFLNLIQLLRNGSLQALYCDNFEIRVADDGYEIHIGDSVEPISESEMFSLQQHLISERKRKLKK